MDSHLIKRVQQDNDHHAFERLVQHYQSPIRQFLRRLLNNDHAVADELSQETFLKAFIHIKTYRGEGKFLSWLFKIAYQQFVSTTRKKTELSNYELAEPTDEGRFEKNIQEQRTVRNLLMNLNTDERATILLHYSHGLTHQEISVALEIPLGSVKSLIRRGKIKLKEQANAQEENHE